MVLPTEPERDQRVAELVTRADDLVGFLRDFTATPRAGAAVQADLAQLADRLGIAYRAVLDAGLTPPEGLAVDPQVAQELVRALPRTVVETPAHLTDVEPAARDAWLEHVQEAAEQSAGAALATLTIPGRTVTALTASQQHPEQKVIAQLRESHNAELLSASMLTLVGTTPLCPECGIDLARLLVAFPRLRATVRVWADAPSGGPDDDAFQVATAPVVVVVAADVQGPVGEPTTHEPTTTGPTPDTPGPTPTVALVDGHESAPPPVPAAPVVEPIASSMDNALVDSDDEDGDDVDVSEDLLDIERLIAALPPRDVQESGQTQIDAQPPEPVAVLSPTPPAREISRPAAPVDEYTVGIMPTLPTELQPDDVGSSPLDSALVDSDDEDGDDVDVSEDLLEVERLIAALPARDVQESSETRTQTPIPPIPETTDSMEEVSMDEVTRADTVPNFDLDHDMSETYDLDVDDLEQLLGEVPGEPETVAALPVGEDDRSEDVTAAYEVATEPGDYFDDVDMNITAADADDLDLGAVVSAPDLTPVPQPRPAIETLPVEPPLTTIALPAPEPVVMPVAMPEPEPVPEPVAAPVPDPVPAVVQPEPVVYPAATTPAPTLPAPVTDPHDRNLALLIQRVHEVVRFLPEYTGGSDRSEAEDANHEMQRLAARVDERYDVLEASGVNVAARSDELIDRLPAAYELDVAGTRDDATMAEWETTLTRALLREVRLSIAARTDVTETVLTGRDLANALIRLKVAEPAGAEVAVSSLIAFDWQTMVTQADQTPAALATLTLPSGRNLTIMTTAGEASLVQAYEAGNVVAGKGRLPRYVSFSTPGPAGGEATDRRLDAEKKLLDYLATNYDPDLDQPVPTLVTLISTEDTCPSCTVAVMQFLADFPGVTGVTLRSWARATPPGGRLRRSLPMSR